MTFVRRDIYIRDVLRVVDLASAEPRLQRRLTQLDLLSFPKSWAIDEAGSFMLRLPAEMREGSAHKHYFFFYLSHFFEVRWIEFLGSEVSFHNFPSDLEHRRGEVQTMFAAAARVHGTSGYGPNGRGKSLDTEVRDDSEERFVPAFVQDDVKEPDM